MVRPSPASTILAMAATLCSLQRAAAFLPAARLATVAARPAASHANARVLGGGARLQLAMISTEAKGPADSMDYRVFFKVRPSVSGLLRCHIGSRLSCVRRV